MLMSDEDRSRIKAVADARGVSMARLMQESALSESHDRRERMAMIAALDTANRLLANIAGNLNQLSHHANMTQELLAHAELETALGQVRDLRDELNETLRLIK
jgi:ribosomal protein L17